MKNVFSTRRGDIMIKKIKHYLNEYFYFTFNNSTNYYSHINNEKLVASFQLNSRNINIFPIFPSKSSNFINVNCEKKNYFFYQHKKHFSTNISLDEIDDKKKTDGKKDTKKISPEKIEQETIDPKKINVINLSPLNLKKEEAMTNINLNDNKLKEKKENLIEDGLIPLNMNRIKFLKKISPDFKVVIRKKIKKFIDKNIDKSLYSIDKELETKLKDSFSQTKLNINEKINNSLENPDNSNPMKIENLLNDKSNYRTLRIQNGMSSNKNDYPITVENENDFINEEFSEYKKIVEMIHTLNINFDIQIFLDVVNYIQENSIEDAVILRKTEKILIENIKEIDCSTKSDLILIISKQIQKKKIKFQEESWYIIYKDFLNLSELNLLSFKDYYNFTISFEKIKAFVSNYRPRFVNEFEKFINFDNIQYFNSGKMKFKNLDDVILLSSLIHAKIFNLHSINDNIWMSLNQLIVKNCVKFNINTLLVISSLFINFAEVSSKAPFLLNEAITEIGKFISSIFKNFEFFEYTEKMSLYNFSDSLFNFYLIYLHNTNNIVGKTNHSKVDLLSFDTYMVQNLIKLYTEKIKHENNFNLFHELRILIFLAKEIKYFNEEFWAYCAGNMQKFLKIEFMTKIFDILPKRLNNESQRGKASAIEIEEMSKLFYYGVIIEVFSTVKYLDERFWNEIIEQFDDIVPKNKKDPLILLQFISLHCKKLYREKIYEKVYQNLIDKFSPEYKRIFLNLEILEFLIGVNFKNEQFDREKNNKLILNLVNPLYPLCGDNFQDNVESIKKITLENSEIMGKEEKLVENNDLEKENMENRENIPNVDKILIVNNETEAIEALSKLEFENIEVDEKVSDITFISNKSKRKSIYRIENNEENSQESKKNKDAHNLVLLMTYLNLIWSKNIFEEENVSIIANIFLDLVRFEKDLFDLVASVKNFTKNIPDVYLNSFENKVLNRLLYLINQEADEEGIDKFIEAIKFLNESEILTIFNMNVLRVKLEKNNRLTPKLYSYFFKMKL